MRFADKLKGLMTELNISQTQLSDLTGIGKSSISQYLSGKNEPNNTRKREIALALGVQEDYFNRFIPPDAVIAKQDYINLPVPLVAKLMGKSIAWVQQGLIDGRFPWGYAVKVKKWSFFVSAIKFSEHTGIQIPSCDRQKGA